MIVISKDIEDPKYIKKFNENPIFVKPVTLTLQNLKIDGYCYCDQKREQNEKETFYTGLHDVREKLQEVKIPKWRNPRDIFRKGLDP